jgi:hypothetical protein
MTHIEAIEAIINGASPAGTSGTASKTAKPGTLEHAQIEEIRNHPRAAAQGTGKRRALVAMRSQSGAL